MTTADESSTIAAKHLRSALVFIFAINVLTAILFMFTVRRPVYDDNGNMLDARAYAAHGISASTIRAQHDTPGPTSFIWMAFAIRLMGHDDLLDARMSVLLSWLLLFALTMVAVRHGEWAGLWYGALLATLILPHSLTAMAAVLTEGPALLFAVLGTIAWTEWVSGQDRPTSMPFAWVIVGALLIGLAATSRQYYLALFPAAGVLALVTLRGRTSEQVKPYLGRSSFALILGLLPVLAMVFLWKGITSPGMAAGTSFGKIQAGIGLNFLRPVDVAFYVALYLVPFTLPAIWRPPVVRNWRAILFASLVGLVATHFRIALVNPGPLHSLLEGASRIPLAAGLLFWIVATVTVYNLVAVGSLLWSERSRLGACPPAALAVLVVLFFIVEQVGVGGNIPFYDRYVLELGPFLGIIAFWLLPSFTRSRILALAGLALVSYGMLWRYAFIGQ